MTKCKKIGFFTFNYSMFVLFVIVINGALKSAHFPHGNTQMPCRDWTQSIVTAATSMFL